MTDRNVVDADRPRSTKCWKKCAVQPHLAPEGCWEYCAVKRWERIAEISAKEQAK